MNRAIAAVALAALLALPGLAAAASAPDVREPEPFPEPYVAQARAWVTELRATVPTDRPWSDEALAFLDNATTSLAEGRLRTGIGTYEFAYAFVRAQEFLEETRNLSTNARRSQLIARSDLHAEEGLRAFSAFRDTVRRFDENVTGLRAFEGASFVAALGVEAHVTLQNYAYLRRELASATTVGEALAFSAYQLTEAPRHTLSQLPALLDAAALDEGLHPPLLREKVDARARTFADFAGSVQDAILQPYARVTANASKEGETALAVGAYGALIRANHNIRLSMIYGDAAGRNGDKVIHDLRRNFAASLNVTDPGIARDRGLHGLFILDALDVGNAALANNATTMSNLQRAWGAQKASLELTALLGSSSPVQPAQNATVEGDGGEGKGTPGPGVAAGLALLATLAVAVTPRRRR